jgi:hypothetical protein
MLKKQFGLQSIDQKLSQFLKPLLTGSKKDFIIIGNMVKNWEEIIGKKYAKLCYPKAISFAKDKQSQGKLTIAVYNSAVGFFLENNSEIIIERIAVFYGYKAIGKIIIKQEPKDININRTTEIKLPQAQENFLQEKINEVADQDLAETLRKLGREIFK